MKDARSVHRLGGIHDRLYCTRSNCRYHISELSQNKEKIAGADVLGKPVPGIPKPTVPGVPRVPEVHTAGKTDQKAPQYIVHTELENGYMNLNGVRVKIKDADKLEW